MSRISQSKSGSTPDTRSEILRQAALLFSEKGYSGTSMADLAAGLNLSKAAIYHHFTNKESILQELLTSTVANLEALIEEKEALPLKDLDRQALLFRFADGTFAHREVFRVAFTLLPAEMKSQSSAQYQIMFRLHKLLAGPKPSAEKIMRARTATGIITTSIFRPAIAETLKKEEENFALLKKIAGEVLQ